MDVADDKFGRGVTANESPASRSRLATAHPTSHQSTMLAIAGLSPLSFQLTALAPPMHVAAAAAGPRMMFGGGDNKEGGGFM